MKLITLSIICFFFTSSQTVLHQAPPDTDPIIGKWHIEKTTYLYSDGTSKDEISMKCSNSKVFTYLQDGTLEFRSFEFNNETEQCTVPSNDFWEGSWKKGEEGYYIRSLTYKYKTKVRSRDVDSTGIFKFSDNNKTMTQILNYEASGIVMDKMSRRIEEHTVFKRLD